MRVLEVEKLSHLKKPQMKHFEVVLMLKNVLLLNGLEMTLAGIKKEMFGIMI